MQSKKIFILLGNPDVDTFSGRVATAYQEAAVSVGHEVRRLNLGELSFDPILHNGYKRIQELEPDLLKIQESIMWADHFVVIYPNWWCTMPALLKGMFDRMWLPGFAFNFDKKTKKVIKLLKGKTARVIIVAGTHSPFRTWLKFGDFSNEISRGTLGFAGMDVSVSTYGPIEKCPQNKLDECLAKVATLGRLGV